MPDQTLERIISFVKLPEGKANALREEAARAHTEKERDAVYLKARMEMRSVIEARQTKIAVIRDTR